MNPDNRSGNGAARRPRELTGRTVLICLVAFFAVVAGVNGIMVRAAVSTFGGVETQSSYRAGLLFASELAASHAQDARNWKVRASIVHERAARRVEITARDAEGRPLTGLTAVIRLAHPADRRADRLVETAELSPGRFSGAVDAVQGQWDLAIELMRGEERVFRSKSRVFLK
jgi:nitrogen fixation protein FixH